MRSIIALVLLTACAAASAQNNEFSYSYLQLSYTQADFDNLAGEFGAHVFEDGSVRVEMTEPFDEKLNQELVVGGQVFAAHSINTGSAWDFFNKMGPLIKPPLGDLKKALTELEPGESWALEPRNIDGNPYFPVNFNIIFHDFGNPGTTGIICVDEFF